MMLRQPNIAGPTVTWEVAAAIIIRARGHYYDHTDRAAGCCCCIDRSVVVLPNRLPLSMR